MGSIKLFYSQRDKFSLLVEQVYMNNEIEELRMVFADRFNTFLTQSEENNFSFEEEV